MKFKEPKFDRMILNLDNEDLLPCEYHGKKRNGKKVCSLPAKNIEVFPQGARVIKEGRRLCTSHANIVAKKFNIRVAKE